jgi:hypothetical protein
MQLMGVASSSRRRLTRPRAGFNHRAAETVLPPLAVAARIAAALAAVVYLDRTLLEQTQLPAQAHNS